MKKSNLAPDQRFSTFSKLRFLFEAEVYKSVQQFLILELRAFKLVKGATYFLALNNLILQR